MTPWDLSITRAIPLQSPLEALTTIYVYVPGLGEYLGLNPSFPVCKLYNWS